MSRNSIKPVSIALGTALVTSLTATNLSADSMVNPFSMNELSSGYMQLAQADSANKAEQEGKCGSKSEMKQNMEGKCGEGKCGSKSEMKQNMEGKCGGKKSEQEGKCGEGKCGGSKK